MLIELYLSRKYIIGKQTESFLSFHTLLSLLCITIAAASLFVVVSVMDGFGEQIKSRILAMGSHIQILAFRGDSNYDDVIAKIKSAKNISGVAPMIVGEAIKIHGGEINLISLHGIDSMLEEDVSSVSRFIISGESVLDRGQIIIGNELARYYGLNVGDLFSLQNPHNGKLARFSIAGIFHSGMYAIDRNSSFISLKEAQYFYGMGNKISGYKIMLNDEYMAAHTKQELSTVLGPRYDLHTWIELNKSLLGAIKIERKIMVIIMSILILIAGLNISSTLTMVVLTKKREIGIMMSMGFANNQIRNIFLIYGAAIGISGCFIGIIIGYLTALNINTISGFLEYATGMNVLPNDIFYFDTIPIQIRASNAISIAVFSFFTSLIASYYPAFRASRLSPVEVLKSD